MQTQPTNRLINSPVSISFPKNYAEGRRQFLAAAEKSGAEITSYLIAARGPQGEELHIDFARVGPRNAKKVFSSISGVNGPEGRLGTAIQSATLELLSNMPSLPPESAFFFCHAFNPHGYAHGRRVNDRNVDLSRSCYVDDSDLSRANNPGFEKLVPFLMPNVELSKARFYFKAFVEVGKSGLKIGPLKSKIMLGQHRFDKMLYYGGKEAQESWKIFKSHVMREWQASEKIIGVDIYSGFGPNGVSTILQSGKADPDLLAQLKLPAPDFVSANFKVNGDVNSCLSELFGAQKKVLFVTQEIGTINMFEMLRLLINENCSYRQGNTDPKHPTRLALEEAFSPSDPKWRAKVVNDGVNLANACFGLL